MTQFIQCLVILDAEKQPVSWDNPAPSENYNKQQQLQSVEDLFKKIRKNTAYAIRLVD